MVDQIPKINLNDIITRWNVKHGKFSFSLKNYSIETGVKIKLIFHTLHRGNI